MKVELWLREKEGPVQSEGELGLWSVFQWVGSGREKRDKMGFHT